MLGRFITVVLLASGVVNATVAFPRSVPYGPCTGENGVIGVCVKTASCTKDGGKYIDDACPGTPEDIKCCTKPKCQLAAQSGDCRWVENCGGGKPILQNLCPGPDAFRCCVTDEGNSLTALLPSATGNTTASSSSGTGTSTTSKQEPKPTPKPTPKPEPDNIGEKILKKAKEAEGIQCMC